MISYRERLQQLRDTATANAPSADSDAVLETLHRLIVDVLEIPDGKIDPERSFKDLGLSSLLAVRLLDRINRRFELRLGVETLFNYGDTGRLAAHIATLTGGPAVYNETQAQPRPAGRSSDNQAVAIIGYAGKFAGAENAEMLWQALLNNRPLISEMPGYRRQDPAIAPPRAGFLLDAERFDADFFGISPREAAAMDPAQRHFLEQAWCALEHAGLTRKHLSGQKVGVYAGASGSGYERSVPISGKAMDAYVMTGNLASMTAARVAYFLDLNGPAVTVDTACSSSLTAVHLACQALLEGEIDIAIAGGASLFVDERAFSAMQRAGMTSPSQACHAFDGRADGIVVAEGAGCVILKTAARAAADDDRVDAVIRASGVNQDGRSNGITAPSALAQAELLRSVLAKAGIAPGDIDLIETHGTGTSLGDPIEAAALREVHADRPAGRPLRVAALKACIGHASEAAGIGGLIATLSAMHDGQFPPIVGFSRLNPHLERPGAGNDVLAFFGQAAPWPETDGRPRRAAISAFGLSGTNVHLVLEQAPPPAATQNGDQGSLPFLLSAATPADLERRQTAFTAWLAGRPDSLLPALANTLMRHREPMACRWAACAGSVAELREKLHADAASDEPRLAAWLSGQAPLADWPSLPSCPPLALPTYPFHGPRLWGGKTLPETGDASPEQDPLLGVRQADGSFLRQFRADEPLVADHRVAGQPLVHAAVLLEICLAAVDRCAPDHDLSELAWLQPLAVSDTTPVKICVRDGTLTIADADTDYLSAKLSDAEAGDPPKSADSATLWENLPAVGPSAEPAAGDVFLGPSFPGPDRIRADGQQALAFLERASCLPTVLDVAIRTAAAAIGAAEASELKLRFPARLARLRRVAPLPEGGLYFHARRRNTGSPRTVETVDVTVYDRHGAPLLQLAGLTLAAACEPASETAHPVPASPPCEAASWRVVWQETAAPGHSYREQSADLIVAAADDSLAEQLARMFPKARRLSFADVGQAAADLPRRAKIWVFDDAPATRTMDLFHLIQALVKAGYSDAALTMRLVTRGALAVHSNETVSNADGAAMLGLAKAAGREFPAWRMRLIDCETGSQDDPALLDRLLSESGDPLGEPVALRGEHRFLQRLAALDEQGDAEPIRLFNGVHVIILGGMGRLGKATASHLARRYRARLSLMGRSPLDGERSAVLEDLRQAGGNASYFTADIGNPAELQAALDQALAAYGPAALLIQATVDPAFARLERALSGEFEAALRPKVTGLLNIGNALANRPIGALAVYSSIGAFTGFPANDGQASYSTACNFEAGHALRLLREWGKPVKVIHWGLWNSGDYGEGALANMQASGLYPMDPNQLGETLTTLLHAPYPQLVHARLATRIWLDFGAAATEPGDAPLAEAARQALASASTINETAVDVADAKSLLARRIAGGLSTAFSARGFKPSESLSRIGAIEKLAVLPCHRQLGDALLNVAVRHGLGKWDTAQTRFHFLGGAAEPISGEFNENAPGLQATLSLLQRCLDALPQVLAGERPGTDVLFPGGSMDWVEPIYRDQPVLADCSRRLAAAVTAAAALGSGRILEIGAGTGSTTGPVLDALREAGLEAATHYLYTDISKAFVRHGQTRFGERLAGARTLDINLPAEEQGIEPGAWDIVIASNVLHATADIRRTLGHVAALLAPGGIVLINEMVEPDDFATLTFGLLDSWWESRDPECRLADGPILGITGWREALRCAGLQGRWAYDRLGRADGNDGGQAILLACKAPGATSMKQSGIRDQHPAPLTTSSEKTSTPNPSIPATSPGKRSRLETALRDILSRILDVPTESLERERPFMEIGVDSLIAPQIAEEVQARLACPLRVTDIYKHGHLAALAEHLAGAYGEHLRLPDLPAEPEQSASPATAVGSATSPDDIAIIGLSARFAGAPDLDALWKLLDEGRDAFRPVDRFNIDPWFDANGGPDKTYARWGGFLNDYDRFDPYFFNITPAEAEVMDPQQRVLMEETWKALENAGLDPNGLSAARCGLFVGASANNYQAQGSPGLRTLGGSMAILSARMAYLLNLRGPNFPIDTGCSSSLVALHQACQSLRSGECDLALAGGVSVNLLSPDIYLYLSDAGMISHDGAGRTFDDDADGFVPGEGAGMAVLKRLGDALADGDRIDAVIVGSGINQDGRTAGLTAPSAEAQAALTQEIYQRFGLNPADFGMIEAHGTGTRLGDPIEVQALAETFRRYTDRRGGCAIGSVKTNVGHTMAAAGMAGIAKAVLALRHRKIPASLNFNRTNRHIDFADSPFFVPTGTVPWPEGRAAQAAVSSFGFSGTNAHIVLQEGITPQAEQEQSASPGPWMFAVSARDAGALKRRLRDLAAWLREQPASLDMARVAENLARGRAHWRYRRAFLASDPRVLAAELEQASASAPAPVPNEHIPQNVDLPATPEGLRSSAEHYEQGDLPDWQALFGRRKPPLALPGYPFARERFWSMNIMTPETSTDYPIGPEHPLLSAHRVGGTPILPGTLSLELLRGDAAAIEHVAWLRPLTLADVPARLHSTGTGERTLTTADGQRLAAGRTGQKDTMPAAVPDFSATVRLDGDQLYARLARSGFEYGQALRVIDWVEIGRGAARARLLPPAELLDDPLLLGATLLDGALQTAAAIGHIDAEQAAEEQWVPHRLGALRVRQRLSGPCLATAWLEENTDDPDRLVFNVLIQDDDGQALAAFEGMAAQRLSLSETVPQLYRPVWQTCAEAATLPAPATILLNEQADQLAGVLAEAFPDARCITVSEDAEPALPETLSGLPGPLLMVQALPERILAEEHPTTVANALAAADPLPPVRAAFDLAQALLSAGRRDDCRLLTVATVADGDPAWNAAAAIAGLYRTLKLEAPALDARVVLAVSNEVLHKILPEEILAESAPEPLLHYASETRQVRAWQTAPLPPAPEALPKGDGTVLISGGLGGLGLALAERLATEGATQIALLSRSSPDDTTVQAALARIEKLGAEVMTQAVDIGNPRALAQAVRAIRDTLGPISAIYHLAGVLHDGFLINKDQQGLRDVFHAKARGAILLDELTRNDPVEAFVLFSSTAAVFGSVGQADYGAANAFLAGFAAARQARGAKTLCVHWPLWAEGGMRPSSEACAFLDGLGMKALPNVLGFDCLARIATLQDSGEALLLNGDSGLFERLRNASVPRSTEASADESLPADTGFNYLCLLLGAIVKLPRERIEPDVTFEDLGIDSIAIMKLNRQMESDLGPIAKTLFFEYRTPETLAAYLAGAKAHELAAHLRPRNEPPAVSKRPPENVKPLAVPGMAPQPPAAADNQPIAIVGVSGLYPMAADLDQFWNNLVTGRDCISEIPPERWPLAGFYDPDRDRPATSHCKWGGFIYDADRFDTRFFGIAPLEAETLDPQARKFLEVSWNALEDAGLDPERMFDGLPMPEQTRRRCGVFVGVMYGDYQLFGPEEAQKGNLIGPNADYWNIANRVSAFLDLHGPSMAVDTACSSSLSAIHLACQAIRAGDCTMAIAGGVNLCLHPRRHWILSKAGMAASDGHCHSFGDGGDGYVPGEGIGAVVLKPLNRAKADGDRIHGVILGSALNHGGHTSGYTVPNPVAQGEAVAEALRRAGIDPRSISYLEAHGTGTPLGDPIEIRGLSRAFADAMPADCAIGSVKGNIGHLESAAGIAGLTKVLLQMRKHMLSPTLYADPPNPDIDFSGTGFRLATRQEPWQGAPLLRAGISSFGAGGANAHLIIEAGEADAAAPPADEPPQILLLSARDKDALHRRAGQLAAHLTSETGRRQALADIAHTLAAGRKVFGERLAVLGPDRENLAAALQAFAEGSETPPDLWQGQAGKNVPPAADNNPAALAAAWVAGSPPPALPGRRVALPGYPFAKRRLWVKITTAEPLRAAPHQPSPQRFAADRPPLADHRIAGQPLLPGAFSLLAALQAAPAPSLSRVSWPAPGTAAPGRELSIEAYREGERIRIRSGDGECLLDAHLSEAELVPETAERSEVPLAGARRLDAAAVYAALASAGAEYGPSLQVLAEVDCGDGEAVARLRSGSSAAAMLDATFQLCFALIPEQLSGQALLPAKIGHITVADDLTKARTLVATRRSTDARGISVDFRLLDETGKPIARIDDFQALAASASEPPTATPHDPEPPLRLLRPQWRTIEPAPEIWIPGRSRILAEDSDDSLALALAAHWQGECGGLSETLSGLPDAIAIILGAAPSDLKENAERTGALLEILRRHLQDWSRVARPPAILLLSRTDDDDVFAADPRAAAAAAFLRAATRERQDWPLITLTLPESVWEDAAQGSPLPHVVLAALPESVAGETVPPERDWRSGILRQRFLAPVELPQAAPPWRDGDVLLIAGAGGLGGLLARHAASCAQVSVALLGRSPTPNAATATTIAALKAAHRPVAYYQADLADSAAVAVAVEAAVTELGAIDWLAHTALVMGDAPIGELTAETLQSVLAPKTSGLTGLAAHVRPRRGLLLFSSSNALTANPGQAAYAAASAFVDAAAGRLPYPVHVFDWGFWGETGAVADAAHQVQLAKLGVFPIRDREGLECMERIIAAGMPRVAVLRVADRLLEPMGVDIRRTVRWRPDRPGRDLAAAATKAAQCVQHEAERFADPAVAVLNAHAARRLWQALADAGVALAAGQKLDGEGLSRALHAKAEYRPLLDALAELLQRAGLSDAVGRSTGSVTDPAALAEKRRRLENDEPATAPTLALLETCMLALGDVVAGKRDAASVLFGEGEAAVAALYRGNPVVDHFQRLVAAAVAGAVQAPGREESETSLLEVGAGTGGTTGFILQALENVKTWRYRITDIGAGLVNATAERLDPERKRLQAGRLDVTQPFEAQGVKPGSVDVLIAANVLHATPDLLDVLAHIKQALRPGGLLILNEATSRQDINTLTFGLTPGWWAYRDRERRCPYGPLLDPERWRETLAEAGFTVTGRFGLPLAGGGEHPLQNVIIAVADAFVNDSASLSQAKPAQTPSQPAAPADGTVLSGLERSLQQLIAEILRLAPEELGLDDSFADHGADSILSVELVRRINAAFGIDLKSTALFNYATVRELAAYMAREHGVAATPDAGGEPADDSKTRTRRLREVIERRRAAAPVNREAEFWQRENGQPDLHETPRESIANPPAPADLEEVLRLLEAGEISVTQAMELNYADE